MPLLLQHVCMLPAAWGIPFLASQEPQKHAFAPLDEIGRR